MSEINKIFRIALVDCNFDVKKLFPVFYTSEERAKEAIERYLNEDIYKKDWTIKDWHLHPWQYCRVPNEGEKCIKMLKVATFEDNILRQYHYQGYGIICYDVNYPNSSLFN